MKLIVGLGNIGETYTHTRHNLGWMAVEAFATTHQAGAFSRKAALQALVTTVHLGESTILALPTTYMNVSGRAVRLLADFYHVLPEAILIVQDELDLPLGVMRFSLGGGAAGHNGIRSIQETCPDALFPRLRLGIDRPSTPQPIEKYVLERFPKEDDQVIKQTLERAVQAIDTWRTAGLDVAQQSWNGVRA